MNDKQTKEKMDAHLKAMEEKATALEEKADYAEKEATERKRIEAAKSRIAATRQRSISLPKIPGGMNRILIGTIILVIVILLIAKAC